MNKQPLVKARGQSESIRWLEAQGMWDLMENKHWDDTESLVCGGKAMEKLSKGGIGTGEK